MGTPTDAQARAWASIHDGRHTLLMAPTGSGKTLAAFLPAIDRRMHGGASGLRVLYVSPLKALSNDIERNLRAPIAGIAAVAARTGISGVEVPTVALRTGDTPPSERARFRRDGADILITTPESLHLLLTSAVREKLLDVDTIIIDEIHALAGTKRGAHLFLALERLEMLRAGRPPAQRIGLSATQKPLDAVARLLAGADSDGEGNPTARSVAIVDAGSRRALDLRIETPLEDLKPVVPDGIKSGPVVAAETRPSLWPALHPALVAEIRAHTSTLIFVNSRRLAERLANSLNETAGSEIACAHHGSLAREQRQLLEDRLKRGLLPALVATSSLELGIDMGAIDLVVQVEAPPSVSAGLQRVGRAGHRKDAVSKGVLHPKYRHDLLACAAAAKGMLTGDVEEIRIPRNPLDVLAQHIVAAVATGPIPVESVWAWVRRAASFNDLPRSAFEGVLDMLSGRWPSDDFAELRPRVTWDRNAGMLLPRAGAFRVAVVNGGTIPDRGLYGVFLSGSEAGKPVRVGELDEEMVFESRPGDVFNLGASAWRIDEITHDRVLVSPAPGENGKPPFWRGDRVGRPFAFGRNIGALTRDVVETPRPAMLVRLREAHALSETAAEALCTYVDTQREAGGAVPTDREIVVERFLDEIGDWRICVLSPFGARVHGPWALAVTAAYEETTGTRCESVWSDDGMVFRFPEATEPPEATTFIVDPERLDDLVVREVGGSALFAARFRENAARALLLVRKRPGERTPLWQQRKRAADLLAVASKFPGFPMVLETMRECLSDVFDLPALKGLLTELSRGSMALRVVDARSPSVFAQSLLFSYVGNFIYEGDAPLAERRAQVLALDHAQLRELLGEAELRRLLDPDAMEAVERRLQRLDPPALRSADALHDALLALGPLSVDEIVARTDADARADVADWCASLGTARRIVDVRIGGTARLAAVEDVGRLRDALGYVPPLGIAGAFLEPVADPLLDLVARYARTHAAFTAAEAAARIGTGVAVVRRELECLAARGKVLAGAFRASGSGEEWCDAEALRSVKRRSLAKARAEIEPVELDVYARFLLKHHGIAASASGDDALIAAIETIEGVALPATVLFDEVLPARVARFRPFDLDRLCAEGIVVWRGAGTVGSGDLRIRITTADRAHLLAVPSETVEGPVAESVRRALTGRGGLFFGEILTAVGGFPAEVLDVLWKMVAAGEVTNDSTAPLRARLFAGRTARDVRTARLVRTVARRVGPPGSEGRWSLLPPPGVPLPHVGGPTASETERAKAVADALLVRWGVATREAALAEEWPGGFTPIYEVLKAAEERGGVRRGWFIAGLGAAQFARAGTEDLLRSTRGEVSGSETRWLSALDPALPWGALAPWPATPGKPARTTGAKVLLFEGAPAMWMGKGGNPSALFPPSDPALHAAFFARIAETLAEPVRSGAVRVVTLTKIDGVAAEASPLAGALATAGFRPTSRGLVLSAADVRHLAKDVGRRGGHAGR